MNELLILMRSFKEIAPPPPPPPQKKYNSVTIYRIKQDTSVKKVLRFPLVFIYFCLLIFYYYFNKYLIIFVLLLVILVHESN